MDYLARWILSLELNTMTEELIGTFLGERDEYLSKENVTMGIVKPRADGDMFVKPAYFNMQGMKMKSPGRGLCILVDRNGVTKRYVK